MLPEIIGIEIDNAHKILEGSEDGNLPLFQRIKIWKLFGEYINRRDKSVKLNPPNYLIGHRRRLLLQKICLDKAISMWERKMGSDTKVHDTMDLIESYLKRGYPPIPPKYSSTAQAEFMKLDIENYQDEDNLVFIPCACLSLLSIAICDQGSWLDPDADKAMDRLSPFGCAPDFYISQFYSRNVVELRRYWDWYLNHAVKQAYELKAV